MLKASDEIDLKLSLRACSRGRDFISVSNSFLVIIFFFERVFFSNFLEKNIGPHACLRVNNYFLLWSA